MPLAFHRLIASAQPISRLGNGWSSVTGDRVEVVGYTVFGDFFLRDTKTGEHAILTTMRTEIEPTGYTDPAEFATLYLTHPAVVEWLAKPDLSAELGRRVGPVGADEVYIPVPYPFLGGSGAAETYEKGNVWVFASLVGQCLGLGEPSNEIT